jgi:RNA polymerase sigma-70 factor (ECF subfamily)
MVSAGDGAAAGRLFDRHWQATWRAAMAVTGDRMRAEDAASEAWMRALDRIEQCDPPDRFGGWVRRIAINCAIDAVRADQRLRELSEYDGRAIESGGDAELRGAVAALPLERRVVVALRYWAGMTIPEIAEALDVPLGTASSRLTRAVEDLRGVVLRVPG